MLHDLDHEESYPIILAFDASSLAQSQLGPLLAARVRGQCCPRHARLDRRLDGHKGATQGIVAAMAETAVPRAALAL